MPRHTLSLCCGCGSEVAEASLCAQAHKLCILAVEVKFMRQACVHRHTLSLCCGCGSVGIEASSCAQVCMNSLSLAAAVGGMA